MTATAPSIAKATTSFTFDRELNDSEMEQLYFEIEEALPGVTYGEWEVLYGGSATYRNGARGWAITGVTYSGDKGAEFAAAVNEWLTGPAWDDEASDDDESCPCGRSHTKSEHGLS